MTRVRQAFLVGAIGLGTASIAPQEPNARLGVIVPIIQALRGDSATAVYGQPTDSMRIEIGSMIVGIDKSIVDSLSRASDLRLAASDRSECAGEEFSAVVARMSCALREVPYYIEILDAERTTASHTDARVLIGHRVPPFRTRDGWRRNLVSTVAAAIRRGSTRERTVSFRTYVAQLDSSGSAGWHVTRIQPLIGAR